MSPEKEVFLQQQNLNIQKFLQKKSEKIINAKKNPRTFAFRAVSREEINNRIKSNSPKNQGEFYQVRHEIVEKVFPFFAKLRRNPLKKPILRKDSSFHEEKRSPAYEITKKNPALKFENQTKRKELFEDLIKHKIHKGIRTENLNENSNEIRTEILQYKKNVINFANYLPRKEVFEGKLSTPKDYDKSPEIFEKFRLNNANTNCLIDYAKSKGKKFIEAKKYLAEKAEEPTEFNLLQGFVKTHKIFGANLGCFSPKVGRERPSPLQDRLLKLNEKMGFDCFAGKTKEIKGKEKVAKKKEEKFNLKRFVMEVEREVKRENKKKGKMEEREKFERTL